MFCSLGKTQVYKTQISNYEHTIQTRFVRLYLLCNTSRLVKIFMIIFLDNLIFCPGNFTFIRKSDSPRITRREDFFFQNFDISSFSSSFVNPENFSFPFHPRNSKDNRINISTLISNLPESTHDAFDKFDLLWFGTFKFLV